MSSNYSFVVLIVVAIVLFFVGVLMFIRRNSEDDTMVVTEVEETTSQYRTELAMHIAQLCQYWLGDSITGDPKAYNNDENTITYLDYSTESGAIHIQINWSRNRIHLTYDFFDNAASRHLRIKGSGWIIHGTAPDKKIVAFLRKVLEAELELAKPYHDLLVEFMQNGDALAKTLKDDNGQEYDEKFVLATILGLLTSGIVERRPTPTQARAYVTMVAYIRHYHPEVLTNLRDFVPAPNTLSKLDDKK